MRKIFVLVGLTLLSFVPAVSAMQEPGTVSEACPSPLMTVESLALPDSTLAPLFKSGSPYTCGCPSGDPCVGLKPDDPCPGGGRCVGFMIGPDPILCSASNPLIIQCQCMVPQD